MRLLFTYLRPASFVRDDLSVLEEAFDLRVFEFGMGGHPRGRDLPALWRRQFIWLLRELPEADAVFGWFADYHMLLPVLTARRHRKPVIVSLGGFDCIRMPELDYGIFQSRWRTPIARYVHRNASLLLPVSQSLIHSREGFSMYPVVREQGVRAFVPNLETPYEVVPTGYDPDLWRMGPPERSPVVRTVALVDSEITLRRKGIDLFFAAAMEMPDVPFEVIGVSDELLPLIRTRYAPTPNVRLVGPLPRQALPDLYAETSVYVQLSRAEGMPNVLCEAMLCGCIPVGSKVFGIPDALGGVGMEVETPEPKGIAAAIRQALTLGADERRRAREHIIANFTRERRRSALIAAVERVTRRRRSETLKRR